jgi:hypothetical protein
MFPSQDNNTFQEMQNDLIAVNNRLENFLNTASYPQVTQRLQSSDGFVR